MRIARKEIWILVVSVLLSSVLSRSLSFATGTGALCFASNKFFDDVHEKWTILSSNVNGDEFSILIPVHPNLYGTERGPYLEKNEAVIDRMRTVTGCADGVVYIVEVYDTPNPKKALEGLLDYGYISKDLKSNVTINGFKGKQVLHDGDGYYKNVRYFPTKRRVYVIGVATRDKTNPAANQFLSSLKLGNIDPASTAGNLMLGNASLAVDSSAADVPDAVVNGKEITQKIVIVMQREPNPINGADRYGTVTLQALFSASGHITDIKVIKGLSAKVDQSAVETAKYIRFIPAEKDGRPVSQYLQIEYSFQ